MDAVVIDPFQHLPSEKVVEKAFGSYDTVK
jgi:hypothetical protein